MADRQVTGSGKDSDGDITQICGLWGTRTKREAISDIERNDHAYWVPGQRGERIDVTVVNDVRHGKYLRTDPDKTTRNNLDDLPNC